MKAMLAAGIILSEVAFFSSASGAETPDVDIEERRVRIEDAAKAMHENELAGMTF